MEGKGANGTRSSRRAALLLAAAGMLLAACSGTNAAQPAATGTATGTPQAARAAATPSIKVPAGFTSDATTSRPSGAAAADRGGRGKYAGLEPRLDAQQLYALLQKARLPVSDGTSVTPASDPDGRLGTLHGYTGRLDFLDTSLAQPGTPWSLANGGAIEVFASDADARKAMKALDTANSGNPSEHDYRARTIILRLSINVAADQQSAYGLALRRAVEDDLRRQYRAASAASATPASQP
jgi:hypothetical protein